MAHSFSVPVNPGTFSGATILRKRPLENLPSASGIECIGEQLFVIGDDAPWLYVLDRQGNVLNTIRLLETEAFTATGRIPKPLKPDFEAMTTLEYQGVKMLLIAGSGSLSPQREIGFLLRLDHLAEPTRVSFTELYAALRQLPTVVGSGKLNIEGMAATHEKLFLLQRGNVTGNNVLIEYALKPLMDYLTSVSPILPVPVVQPYRLPASNTVQSGFSGATFLPDSSILLFTASLENTANELDDGEVLGSFVGFIDTQSPVAEPICLPILLEGQPYLGKVESISIAAVHADGSLTALAVTDNDLGSSELLEISLTL